MVRIVQLPEEEHLEAFYEATDTSRRRVEFANASFMIGTDSIDELPDFGGQVDAALAGFARHQALNRGVHARVRSLKIAAFSA
jgi:hypothetical protein